MSSDPKFPEWISLPLRKRAAIYTFPPSPDGEPPLPAQAAGRLGNTRFAFSDARKILPAVRGGKILFVEWRTLRLFDQGTGQLEQLLRFPFYIRDAAWDSAGERVAILVDLDGRRNSLLLWDRRQSTLAQISPEVETACCLAMTPAGDQLVVGQDRGLMRVLSLPEGATVAQHQILAPDHYTSVHAVAISPDGKKAAGWTKACWDQFTEIEYAGATLLLLELPSGRRLVRRVPGYRDADPRGGTSLGWVGEELEFSRDGSRLRSCTDGKTRWTFSAVTGKLVKDREGSFARLPVEVAEVVAGHPSRGLNPIELSPDGNRLSVGDRLLEISTGNVRSLPRSQGRWAVMAFRNRGREVLRLTRSGGFQVFGTETLELRQEGVLTKGPCEVVVPRLDPAHLLVKMRRGDSVLVVRYQRETLRELPPRLELDSWEHQLLPAWGSSRVLTRLQDRLQVHDFEDGSRRSLRFAKSSLLEARVAPDGCALACVRGKRLEILELDSGEAVFSFLLRGLMPTCLAFSPSGRLLAAAYEDWQVRLFDLRTLQLTAELPGHSAEITDLVFTPQEERLLSLGSDGVVLIWELERVRRGA